MHLKEHHDVRDEESLLEEMNQRHAEIKDRNPDFEIDKHDYKIERILRSKEEKGKVVAA